MKYYLGIDLGGTNIVAGLVDSDYNIVARAKTKTRAPRSIEALCEDMAALCRQVTEAQGIILTDLSWVGVGTPGIVWDGKICYANNLGLENAFLARELSQRVNLPVYLHNDASTAAYGEYIAGIGGKCRSLVMVTLGTGIGSGIILEGKIYDGFNGAAPEIGHAVISPGGRLCTCGRKGCFEAYSSATGLIKLTQEIMKENPRSLMWELCEGKLDQVGGRTAFIGRLAGDSAAIKTVDIYIEYLAIGIANIVNFLQPEIICVGGGISKEGDGLILPLRKRVAQKSFSGRDGLRTEIVAAKLLNDAGIIGAAMLGNLAGGEIVALKKEA